MNFNQNGFNHCLLASSARGFQCLLTCIVVSSVYLLASWFPVFTWTRQLVVSSVYLDRQLVVSSVYNSVSIFACL